MQLDLNDNDVEAIGRILRNYLGDLRMEIRDTENYEFRQGLKQDEEIIKSFLARLPTPGLSQSRAPAQTTGKPGQQANPSSLPSA